MKKILVLLLCVAMPAFAKEKKKNPEKPVAPTIITGVANLKVTPNTIDVGGTPKKISFTKTHACAIVGEGKEDHLKCWGANDQGQLGLGDTNKRDQPTKVSLGGNVRNVSVSGQKSCAIVKDSKDQSLKCWGEADASQPIFAKENILFPQKLDLGKGISVLGVLLSDDVSCMIQKGFMYGDKAKCWGKLDPSIFEMKAEGGTPQEKQFGYFVRDALLVNHRTCAMLRTSRNANASKLKCWGDIFSSDYFSKEYISQIAGSHDATCVVMKKDNQLRCWGSNAVGIFGNGTTNDSREPSEAVMFSGSIQKLSMGRQHACAVVKTKKATQLQCWGDNHLGQISSENKNGIFTKPTPVEIAGNVKDVFLSGDATCAIVENSNKSTLECWGDRTF